MAEVLRRHNFQPSFDTASSPVRPSAAIQPEATMRYQAHPADMTVFSQKVQARRLGLPEGIDPTEGDFEKVLDVAICTFGEGRLGEISRRLVASGAICESKTPEGHQCTQACVCAINIDMGGMEDNFPACRDHVLPLMHSLVEDVAANGFHTIPGINGHFRS